jgi:hypothetical protein
MQCINVRLRLVIDPPTDLTRIDIQAMRQVCLRQARIPYGTAKSFAEACILLRRHARMIAQWMQVHRYPCNYSLVTLLSLQHEPHYATLASG